MDSYKESIERGRLCSACAALDFDDLVVQVAARPRKAIMISNVPNPGSCDFCYLFEQTAIRNKRSRNEVDKVYVTAYIYRDYLSSNCGLTAIWSKADHDLESRHAFPDFLGRQTFQILEVFLARTFLDLQTGCPANPQNGEPRSGRYIPPYLNAATFAMIRAGLEKCQGTHSQCTSIESSSKHMPLWLVDCRSRFVLRFQGAYPPYLALSYVWGQGEPPVQMPRTYEHENITTLPPQLPQTILDAMEISVQLGFQFLWVGQCCIDQSDIISKHEQILGMGRIYSAAAATIIVACNTKASDGIRGISTPRQQIIASANGRAFILQRDEPGRELPETVWFSRGWCFQEALLTQRLIVFTASHVSLECSDSLFTELADSSNPSHSLLKRFSDYPCIENLHGLPPERLPSEIIHSFTGRQLSSDEDRLNAVEGVSQAVSLHYHGLPYALSARLASKVPSRASIKESVDYEIMTPTLLFICSNEPTRLEFLPSFSWIGCTGRVFFPQFFKSRPCFTWFPEQADVAVKNGKPPVLLLNARIFKLHFQMLDAYATDSYVMSLFDGRRQLSAPGHVRDAISSQSAVRIDGKTSAELCLSVSVEEAFGDVGPCGTAVCHAALLALDSWSGSVCRFYFLLIREASGGCYERIGVVECVIRNLRDKLRWNWTLQPKKKRLRSQINLI